MWFINFATALVATLSPIAARAGTYTLADDYTISPANFFNKMGFFTAADPTNGFVKFLDAKTAISSKLIGYTPAADSSTSHDIFIGVDSTNVTPDGRPSIRFSSQAEYSVGMLLIIEASNMPSGCGVWSALWMLGEGTWPDGGEIDIIENVNNANADAVTLHTNAGCSVAPRSARNPFSGQVMTSNCDINASNQDKNAGCQIKAPEPGTGAPATFGSTFNAANGGVYAMEWTEEAIAVFFFPASSTTMPDFSQANLDTRTFGMPLARFAGSSCDIANKFRNMKIVLDTTFCGDWAGNTWSSSGCAAKTGVATCETFVKNHPEAFKESYWNIKALKVYTAAAGVPAPSRPQLTPRMRFPVIEPRAEGNAPVLEAPNGDLVVDEPSPLFRPPIFNPFSPPTTHPVQNDPFADLPVIRPPSPVPSRPFVNQTSSDARKQNKERSLDEQNEDNVKRDNIDEILSALNSSSVRFDAIKNAFGGDSTTTITSTSTLYITLDHPPTAVPTGGSAGLSAANGEKNAGSVYAEDLNSLAPDVQGVTVFDTITKWLENGDAKLLNTVESGAISWKTKTDAAVACSLASAVFVFSWAMLTLL